jgi:hypothetical protein
MKLPIPNKNNNHIVWIVISILFLAVAFYFTFILGNIAQGIICFGTAFAFFIISNTPNNK